MSTETTSPTQKAPGQFNWSLVVIGGAVMLGLLFVLAGGFGRDPHAVPFLLTGKAAPDFKLKRIDDASEVTLQSFKGKPLVLNFWSSWCVPCKAEHPVLEWGYDKLKENVQFVGVVYEDSDENVRAFLAKTPSSYAQLFDPQGRAAVDYGLAGVPETYFIDANGVITYKHIGPIDPDTLLVRVSALLKPDPQ